MIHLDGPLVSSAISRIASLLSGHISAWFLLNHLLVNSLSVGPFALTVTLSPIFTSCVLCAPSRNTRPTLEFQRSVIVSSGS